MPLGNSFNVSINKIQFFKHKIILVLSNKNKISLNKNVYSSFYLYVGKSLSNEEIKKIHYLNKIDDSYSYCLKLLANKSYSEYKLREKLYKRKLNKNDVDFLINKLQSNGLINDELLINDYFNYYLSKRYSFNKIIEKLKNIGLFHLEECHNYFDKNIEKKNLEYSFYKIDQSLKCDTYKKKEEKMYRKLIQLGFNPNDVIYFLKSHKLSFSKQEEKENLRRDLNKLFIKFKNSGSDNLNEINRKIIRKLISKGYNLNDIKSLIGEENEYESC